MRSASVRVEQVTRRLLGRAPLSEQDMEAVEHACPACKASPGEMCILGSPGVHLVRYELARRRKEVEEAREATPNL
jgi:hypothetical protein